MSAKTKIRPAVLEALEQGTGAERLGGFYTRAALRAIARELDLDPEQIVRQYRDEYEAEPEPAPEVQNDPLVPSPPLIHPLWRLAFVATGAVLLVTFLTSRSAPTATREAGAVGTTGAASPAEAVAAEAPAPSPRQEGLTFELRTTKEAWVSATADGNRVLYGLLQPAAHHTLQAQQELTVVIGDASAVEYSINGQRGRVLGGPAEARKILITPNNYAQYLRN